MPHARGAGIWPAFWMLADRGRDYPDNARYGYMSSKYGRGWRSTSSNSCPVEELDGLFPLHMGCNLELRKVTERTRPRTGMEDMPRRMMDGTQRTRPT